MSSSTLTLAPEPIMGSGVGVSAEILARAARDDYRQLGTLTVRENRISVAGQIHVGTPRRERLAGCCRCRRSWSTRYATCTVRGPPNDTQRSAS
jgi:hypothetical protein